MRSLAARRGFAAFSHVLQHPLPLSHAPAALPCSRLAGLGAPAQPAPPLYPWGRSWRTQMPRNARDARCTASMPDTALVYTVSATHAAIGPCIPPCMGPALWPACSVLHATDPSQSQTFPLWVQNRHIL